ncbi:MAG TPA: DMT family transporter [Xanthomonadales bacterium]|nr:DMT family transporter [Xanthomonadales bacterium]
MKHADRARANRSGIVAMIAAVGFLSLMDGGLKALAAHYPPVQVTALRAIASLPIVVAWIAWRRGFGQLLRVRWPLHLLRGVLGVGMLSLFAYALKRLPLADAYSIFFVAPLLITALSVPILGERVDARRWIAIAVGLGGVLIVLKPTGEGMFTLAGLAVLGAAMAYAITAITMRVLSRTDGTQAMMFWLTTMMAIGAGALAAPHWVAVRASDWPVIAGIAVTGALGQYAITEAFSRAEASVVAPFEYTALAWGLGLDWFVWGVAPQLRMLAGAAVIIAAGVYLVHRERVHVEAEHP